jgi:hypothetical protein
MPTALLLLQVLQAAISAAPQAIDIATKGKDLIDSLFTAKLITVEQQNALKNHVDSMMALAVAGIVPDWWKVQPDPA